MSHIFISYSKKNKEYTDKLVDFLEKAGFDVWYDGRIDYGTSWERVIFKAIDDCAVFLVVMSPESYDSDWVRKEYLYADKRKKKQFPILLEGEEFPFYVDNQYTDVRGGKLPPNDFVTRLGRAIKPQNQAGKNITPSEMIDTQLPTPIKPKSSSSKVLAVLPEPFEWIEIPAGKVTIKGHGEFDVPNFQIAKYPITVAQYQIFMNDKGYDIEKYWTEWGWEWRQQNKINMPQYWGDKFYQRFFNSNYPIVGVSWYESVAFCCWLSEKADENILLPTEQQWQRAAQGDSNWVYPWGNQSDVSRCNSSAKSNSRNTTPVMQYPSGKSPYGVMDMVGNVWEWTLTEYNKVKEINPTDPIGPVKKGGSWGGQDILSVDYRDNSSPFDRNTFIGFRIVRLS